VAKRLKNANAVILSDYGKGALADVAAMIEACRAAGLPVLVDPKGNDFEKYRGATLITPNQSEFESVAGICSTDDELVARAREMVSDLDLMAILVTRSEKGMLLVLSNLAAGLVVRKSGAAAVTPSEIRVALHRRGQGGRGLVAEEELQSLVAEAKSRSETVIMTNGCFDILHAGHVAYLEEAKSLGDRLIVAVNDDDSVRKLKGESRPINALEDRMAVLAGLAAVDWVVPFSEDTPTRLIQSLLPDILVKGGDYRSDEIAGAKDVLRNGGEVRALAFRDGHSSSRIIDKLGA